MDQSAREDWEHDVTMPGDQKTDSLDQEQFAEALYQLVDEWCGNFPGASLCESKIASVACLV